MTTSKSFSGWWSRPWLSTTILDWPPTVSRAPLSSWPLDGSPLRPRCLVKWSLPPLSLDPPLRSKTWLATLLWSLIRHGRPKSAKNHGISPQSRVQALIFGWSGLLESSLVPRWSFCPILVALSWININLKIYLLLTPLTCWLFTFWKRKLQQLTFQNK